jgi:hypothetical protein
VKKLFTEVDNGGDEIGSATLSPSLLLLYSPSRKKTLHLINIII